MPGYHTDTTHSSGGTAFSLLPDTLPSIFLSPYRKVSQHIRSLAIGHPVILQPFSSVQSIYGRLSHQPPSWAVTGSTRS